MIVLETGELNEVQLDKKRIENLCDYYNNHELEAYGLSQMRIERRSSKYIIVGQDTSIPRLYFSLGTLMFWFESNGKLRYELKLKSWISWAYILFVIGLVVMLTNESFTTSVYMIACVSFFYLAILVAVGFSKSELREDLVKVLLKLLSRHKF